MSTNYGDLFRLDGKTALITGAGGILGRHFALALSQHGARVALIERSADSLKDAQTWIKESHPKADLFTLQADVSKPEDVARAFDETQKAMGTVQVLFNNAASKGVDVRKYFDPAHQYPLEIWREVMQVNLDGVFLMAREFGARLMEQKKPGSLVNIGSIYGVVGPDNSIYEGSHYLGGAINTPPVYAASKAGVLGLTKYLASTWGVHQIRANGLVPGGVQSGQNDEFLKRYSAKVPLGRMAKTRDLMGAAVFLASDASEYVTGQILCVDGGWTAW